MDITIHTSSCDTGFSVVCASSVCCRWPPLRRRRPQHLLGAMSSTPLPAPCQPRQSGITTSAAAVGASTSGRFTHDLTHALIISRHGRGGLVGASHPGPSVERNIPVCALLSLNKIRQIGYCEARSQALRVGGMARSDAGTDFSTSGGRPAVRRHHGEHRLGTLQGVRYLHGIGYSAETASRSYTCPTERSSRTATIPSQSAGDRMPSPGTWTAWCL